MPTNKTLLVLTLVLLFTHLVISDSTVTKSHRGRRLRDAEITNDDTVDDEERGGGPTLSSTTKLLDDLESGVKKAATKGASTAKSVGKLEASFKQSVATASMKPRDVLEKLSALGVKMDDEKHIKAWLEYAIKYRAQHSSSNYYASDEYLFGALAGSIHDDKKKLADLFLSLRKDPQVGSLAKNIQEHQYRSWLTDFQYPSDVEKMLGLKIAGKSKAELEKQPLYTNWVEYNCFLLNKFANHDISEKAFTKVLDEIEVATTGTVTAGSITTRLKSLEGSLKQTTTKTSVDPGAYIKLLSSQGLKMDEEKNVKVWLEYAIKYRAQHSSSNYYASDEYLFGALAGSIHDDKKKLADLFLSLRKDPQVGSLAKNIQEHQYRSWLTDFQYPSNVEKMLGLKIAGKSKAELEKQPLYTSWVEYNDFLLNKFANHDISEKAFTKVLDEIEVAATGTVTTGTSLAKRLEDLEGSFKLTTTKTSMDPGAYFKQLSSDGLKMDDEKNFKVWLEYVAKYRDQQVSSDYYASDLRLYRMLAINFGDEKKVADVLLALRKDPQLDSLAKSLQEQQYLAWRTDRLSLSDVKKMLGLKGTSRAELETQPAYTALSEYSFELSKRGLA